MSEKFSSPDGYKPISPTYDWSAQARDKQRIPPGDWTVWLILAGRGFGKTRAGAETVRQWAESGLYRRLALVAETEDEARVVMVEGQSGLLNICPPSQCPSYTLSRNDLVWPNGAKAMIYTAERYRKLRGPQFDGAWVDELAKFRNAQEVWDQLMFALRLGPLPRVVVTTTPRPLGLLRTLIASPDTHLTQGSTYENRANLSPRFFQHILDKYEGSPLGEQEIHAKFLGEELWGGWRPQSLRYGSPWAPAGSCED